MRMPSISPSLEGVTVALIANFQFTYKWMNCHFTLNFTLCPQEISYVVKNWGIFKKTSSISPKNSRIFKKKINASEATVFWRVLGPPKRPSEGLIKVIKKANSRKNYIGLKFSPLWTLSENFVQIRPLLYKYEFDS